MSLGKIQPLLSNQCNIQRQASADPAKDGVSIVYYDGFPKQRHRLLKYLVLTRFQKEPLGRFYWICTKGQKFCLFPKLTSIYNRFLYSSLLLLPRIINNVTAIFDMHKNNTSI